MGRSQNEQILQFMQKYGAITPLDAFAEFGCMRLASRISELKKAGYKITSTTCSGVNRAGQKKTYAKYRLED